jgi:hypothetical protein
MYIQFVFVICLFLKKSRGRYKYKKTTVPTCAISAYHHEICEFEPSSWRGELDATLFDNVGQ